jgi:predicted amidohydrolase
MRLALYQFCPEFGEKEANLDKVRSALSGVDCDLLVLPELALTGYLFNSLDELAEMAEPIPGGITCEVLAELASSANCHVVCGMPEELAGRYFNSAVLVGPGGYVGTYRKSHLFLDEKSLFSPGDTGFVVYDIGCARIGIIICFDWIFPEATRILALRGAQIVVQPANLVLPWCQQVALARAWENRVFFLTANRTGSERSDALGELVFTGQSQLISPEGEILFRLDSEEEALQVVEIDSGLADIKEVNERNHVLRDRRTDLYGPLLE